MSATRDPHAIKAMTPADLVDEYRGLVGSIVNKLRARLRIDVATEDLEAYGFEGLLEAHEGFDPTADNLFGTYAYYRIRGAILDGCRKEGWLQRPREARREQAIDELLETNAEIELAAPRPQSLDEAVERVADVVDAAVTVFMLSEVDLEVTAPVPPGQHELLERMDEREALREVLELLSDREREVIQRHHFDGQAMDEIAENFGRSRSWVSRINTRALAKLKEWLLSRGV